MKIPGEAEEKIEDYWTNKKDAHKVQPKKWTGVTIFKKTGRFKARDEKKALEAQTEERMNKIMANLKDDGRMTMDDTFVQPCLQESEQRPQIYEKIERQRSRLEESAYFEKEVEARAEARRTMASNGSKCDVNENM